MKRIYTATLEKKKGCFRQVWQRRGCRITVSGWQTQWKRSWKVSLQDDSVDQRVLAISVSICNPVVTTTMSSFMLKSPVPWGVGSRKTQAQNTRICRSCSKAGDKQKARISPSVFHLERNCILKIWSMWHAHSFPEPSFIQSTSVGTEIQGFFTWIVKSQGSS